MKKGNKIADLENKWKRTLADYQNLEKRIEKEKTEFVRFANAQLLNKLLTIVDDLEKCEEHLKDKGLTLICHRFREVLKSEGVTVMEILGKNFDPGVMDAVEIVKGPKNRVMEVIAKGYLLNGKILRPAKVKVGAGEVIEKQK